MNAIVLLWFPFRKKKKSLFLSPLSAWTFIQGWQPKIYSRDLNLINLISWWVERDIYNYTLSILLWETGRKITAPLISFFRRAYYESEPR